MGSVEPPFARHSEGIFGKIFVELMACILWVQRLAGLFMKRDRGLGTRLGWCHVRCVLAPWQVSACLVLLQSGGQEDGHGWGWTARCPAWLHGPVVIFDRSQGLDHQGWQELAGS